MHRCFPTSDNTRTRADLRHAPSGSWGGTHGCGYVNNTKSSGLGGDRAGVSQGHRRLRQSSDSCACLPSTPDWPCSRCREWVYAQVPNFKALARFAGAHKTCHRDRTVSLVSPKNSYTISLTRSLLSAVVRGNSRVWRAAHSRVTHGCTTHRSYSSPVST